MSGSMRGSRFLLKLMALFAVLAIFAAACGSDDDDGSDAAAEEDAAAEDEAADEEEAAADEETSTAGECDNTATLTWAYGDQIRNWDPHDSGAGQDQWYLMTVYDRLWRQSPEGDTLPGLVEDWKFSEDGLTLTMNIRQGVVFQDGTPLTPEIVVQNLDRARGQMNAPEGEEGFSTAFAADLAAISSVEVVDETTVAIVMSTPNVALPNILSDRPGMMMQPSTFDGTAQTDPIGTGPFTLESWTEGDGGQAVLVKFEDYWDADNIQIAGIDLLDIQDPSARINGILAGDIDGARIDPVDFDTASSTDGLTVDTATTLETFWFNIDIESTPELEMIEVRQAMSLAIDRQALVNAVAFELGTPTPTLMPRGYWAADPALEAPAQDLAAAQALMDGVGVEEFTMTIFTGSNEGLQSNVTQAVVPMLAEIGITVEVDVAGADLVSRLYLDRDGGGIFGPWSGRPDPSQTIANTAGAGFVNIAKQTVPEIDALLIEAGAAVDPAERAAIFAEIDVLYAEHNIAGIGLFSPEVVFVYKDTITGLPIYVQGKHEFRDACVAAA